MNYEVLEVRKVPTRVSCLFAFLPHLSALTPVEVGWSSASLAAFGDSWLLFGRSFPASWSCLCSEFAHPSITSNWNRNCTWPRSPSCGRSKPGQTATSSTCSLSKGLLLKYWPFPFCLCSSTFLISATPCTPPCFLIFPSFRFTTAPQSLPFSLPKYQW